MSPSVANLRAAQVRAIANRPVVQGFPVQAETMRQFGMRFNEWQLPSMQSRYETDLGPVVVPGESLVEGMAEIAPFDRDALVTAIRADQAGAITFPEFAAAAWRAGVTRWTVDFEARVCTYYGNSGQFFEETYPEVELPAASGE